MILIYACGVFEITGGKQMEISRKKWDIQDGGVE